MKKILRFHSQRGWFIWLIYAASVLTLVAALGFVTQAMLELARDRAMADAQVDFEKRIQLALWRLDAIAAPLVSRENARPYREYQGISSVNLASIGVPNNQVQSKGDQQAFRVSNALNPALPDTRLHFQIDEYGRITSPQVPDNNLDDAIASGYTDLETVGEFQEKLGLLGEVLRQAELGAALPAAPVRGPESAQLAALNAQVENVTQQSLNAQFGNQSMSLQQEEQLKQMNRPKSQTPIQQKAQALADFNFRSLFGNGIPSGQQRQSRIILPDVDGLPAKGPNQLEKEITVAEGVMKPLWLRDQLLLGRNVSVDGSTVVQGVWLNWEEVRRTLLASISDVVTGARLEPLDETEEASVDIVRRMAALPVRLVVEEPVMTAAIDQTTRTLLLVVWTALVIAVVAVGLLLRGVVILSERRGTFVSAVTHELRTPLTTFRMYADMLAGDMVGEDKRQRYLNTLTNEAGRLSHLVENVLAYARLERGRPSRRVEKMTVTELLNRITDRLQPRCEEAGFEVVLQVPDSLVGRVIETDTSAVEQVLYNLSDNACKYARTAEDRRLHIEADQGDEKLRIRVFDHGPGIDPKEAARLFKPFAKSAHDAANTAPGVGLGLAISKRLAKALGGNLVVDTSVPKGACFILTLPLAMRQR